LPPETRSRLDRRNVYAFSLSVAAHEVLQMVGLVSGNERISGIGPQTYHCYPGEMRVEPVRECEPKCEYAALIATASDLSGNLRPLA
jgi:hypothetical protein